MLDGKIADLLKARRLMMAALVLLLGLGGVILFLIARSVTQPLNNAVAIAERVAAGDLTSDFHATQQNSALVELATAAAESLGEQMQLLARTIGVFKLNA